MPKQWLKRFMPDSTAVKNHKHLRIFGKLLHEPNLWHLNRHSVCTAVFVGLLVGYIPLPIQTLLAGVLAILLRCNLPLSVLLIWYSNPLTMPAMFYFAYKLGCWLLLIPPHQFQVDMGWVAFSQQALDLWKPLLFGSLLSGLTLGLLGLFMSRLVWRVYIMTRWSGRKKT